MGTETCTSSERRRRRPPPPPPRDVPASGTAAPGSAQHRSPRLQVPSLRRWPRRRWSQGCRTLPEEWPPREPALPPAQPQLPPSHRFGSGSCQGLSAASLPEGCCIPSLRITFYSSGQALIHLLSNIFSSCQKHHSYCSVPHIHFSLMASVNNEFA